MRCVPEVIILERNVFPCVQYESPSWRTFSRTLVLEVCGQFFKLTLRSALVSYKFDVVTDVLIMYEEFYLLFYFLAALHYG
jgi:hypothetical protein